MKAHAWKACIRSKRIGGSNPPLSARYSMIKRLSGRFFVVHTDGKVPAMRRDRCTVAADWDRPPNPFRSRWAGYTRPLFASHDTQKLSIFVKNPPLSCQMLDKLNGACDSIKFTDVRKSCIPDLWCGNASCSDGGSGLFVTGTF